MKKYLLDKVIDVDTLYRAESDKALQIFEVGTDSTSKVTLKIAGSPCLEVVKTICPLAKVNTNLNGLLDLGKQFLIVPPDKTFRFEGASGSKLRLKGYIITLDPVEVVPSDLLARFTVQGKLFKSYVEGSYSSAAAATITAGQEERVFTFTCPSGERWKFAELYMGEVYTTADTIARTKLATRIYIDDFPYDIVETKSGHLGINSLAAPHPAREDVNATPFSLKFKPIELTPGRTLKVTWIHLGTADVTLAAGETLEARVKIVGVKEYL